MSRVWSAGVAVRPMRTAAKWSGVLEAFDVVGFGERLELFRVDPISRVPEY